MQNFPFIFHCSLGKFRSSGHSNHSCSSLQNHRMRSSHFSRHRYLYRFDIKYLSQNACVAWCSWTSNLVPYRKYGLLQICCLYNNPCSSCNHNWFLHYCSSRIQKRVYWLRLNRYHKIHLLFRSKVHVILVKLYTWVQNTPIYKFILKCELTILGQVFHLYRFCQSLCLSNKQLNYWELLIQLFASHILLFIMLVLFWAMIFDSRGLEFLLFLTNLHRNSYIIFGLLGID